MCSAEPQAKQGTKDLRFKNIAEPMYTAHCHRNNRINFRGHSSLDPLAIQYYNLMGENARSGGSPSFFLLIEAIKINFTYIHIYIYK